MSPDINLTSAANATAEEILQAIFGDDLTGCSIRPESIASIVLCGLRRQEDMNVDLIDLYERAIEALRLLSTPPTHQAQLAPEGVPALLSERLDTIHNLTQKLIDTAAAFKARASTPNSTI